MEKWNELEVDKFLRECFDITNNERGLINLSNLSDFLVDKLASLELTPDPQYDEGRLGPKVVSIDKNFSGELHVREHDLELESHSNFSSARSTVCVFKGKWMFEVTLGTAGIQQIGWATLNCPFTNEEGIGDAPDSFAYDGRRVKKWNVTDTSYGQTWVAGDVIGSCIDLETGQITFYRNGASLGVAFSNVRSKIEGIAYFPAASLSNGERCSLNFGGRPFEYPIETYKPLQASPHGVLVKTRHLLACFHRIISLVFSSPGLLPYDDILILCSHLLRHLGPLLENQYAIAAIFSPFLMHLLNDINQLKLAIEIMSLCLEDFEFISAFSNVFYYLGYKCRITPFKTTNVSRQVDCTTTESSIFAQNFTAKGGTPFLSLALALLNCRQVLQSCFDFPMFPVALEALLTTKQYNSNDMNELFPIIWKPDSPEEIWDSQIETYSNELSSKLADHEQLLVQLCELFLNSNTSLEPNRLSPQQTFRQWLRKIISKNRGINRNIQPPGLSDPTVLSNLYFSLLRVCLSDLKSSQPTGFPKKLFYRNKIYEIADLPRLGGTFTHLFRHMKPPEDDVQTIKEEVDIKWELLDKLVLLYHLGLSIRFRQASLHSQNQQQAISQLAETNNKLKTEVTEQLLRTKQLLKEEAMEHIRQYAWHRVVLFTSWKTEAMYSSIVFLVDLLTSFADEDPLFSYVPEYYLETLFDSFNVLRHGDSNSKFFDASRELGLSKIIAFLVDHFNDKRIVNPDQRDLLVQSTSVLLQHKEYVHAFENNSVAKPKLMKALLACFDSRFWVSVSTIFQRFWRGTGFGTTKKGIECASLIFREQFRDIHKHESELFDNFLNRLFNNLNWTVSEFIVTMKDFQNALSRRLVDIAQHQKKCYFMFELSVSLIRMLEILALDVPTIFLQKELNITRLLELLLYVLNRTTVGVEAQLFEDILKLKSSALEKITRWSILASVAGVLINLYDTERALGQHSLIEAILSQPSFQIKSFEYLASFDWQTSLPAEATRDRLVVLQNLLDALKEQYNSQQNKTMVDVDDPNAEVCTICYLNVIDTHFQPCGHQSCHRCIARQLLNQNKCFFCNSVVEKVIRNDAEKGSQ